MNKHAILVLGSVILLAGAVMFWRRASEGSHLAQGSSELRDGQRPHSAVAPTENLRPETEPTATAEGQPTREEEQVLAMYDGMADALVRHEGDCESMGLAIEELVTTYGAQVARLMTARAQLSPSSQAAAQQRLEAVAQIRMGRVRDSLRAGLSTCGDDERLLGALRKLAELNTPS